MKQLLGRTLAAAVLLAAAAPAAAQNPQGPPPGARPGMPGQMQGGTIAGRVVDAEGAPLRSAQVAVWSAADSTLVTGATVRPDGTFRIEGVRPGRYFLRVSALGYASTATEVVAVTPQAPQADVGAVRMAQGAVLLEGLTVTAEAAPTQMAADRNTYSVRDMPAAAGGNATDVLRNVPAIEVDQDGKVSLRGNENVAVQINGRPTPMRGEQLGNFLQQLPANMLERVEVVPNPSARYEPEGMAGIINIVLRENADLGLSGGLMSGVGTGGRANASGNLGYQSGPLTLFGSYGFRMDERQNRGFNYLERYAQPGGAPVFSLDQVGEGQMDMMSHLFNGSADYKLNARDVVSSTLMVSRGRFDNGTLNTFVETDGGSDATRRYLGDNRIEVRDLTFDGVLAFKRTIRPREHELSGEVRLNRGDNENTNRFEETILLGAGPGDPRLESTTTEALSTTASLQADYTRTLAARTRLETGYKGTLRALDNEQRFSAFTGGAWVPDEARSQSFEYEERVNAGYGVLHRGIGKVDAQAGLRVEHTDREFYLASTDQAYPKSYWSFFPSANAALALDDRRQVRLGYSRRITRPDTRLLNPFPFNEDQRNRFVGNPELEPEYTNAFELAYQHSLSMGSLQVTPFFRRTENAIRRIREFRADTTITTFRNLATSDSYGADMNASLRMGRVSGFAGVSAYRTVTDAGSLGDDFSSEAFGWSARANGNLQLSRKLDAQGFVMYRAPMAVEQGRMGRWLMSSVSLRHKVLNDKGSVSLRVMDPFNTMGFTLRTQQPLYFQENERRFGGRAAYLNFSYNFGQQPRLRQRPGQQQPEMQEPQQIPGSMGTP